MSGAVLQHLIALTMQVDAGAEVLLTQPPLLNRQFEAWYEGLSRQVECLLYLAICLGSSIKTLCTPHTCILGT